MLDALTLRVAFAVVGITLLLLFYFVTYRGTRTAYSLWWCIALALFLFGSSCFLLNGTEHQLWANPLGNVLSVTGAASVWVGARTLRGKTPRPWLLAIPAVVVCIPSVMDSPAINTWAGGAYFLATMSVLIGLASWESFHLDAAYSRARWALGLASALVSVYYLLRFIVFVVDGRNGEVFTTWFGSGGTALITLVLVVVASFSMAMLSSEQLARGLRASADETGLEIAHGGQVQQNLMPRTSPNVPGYEVAGACVPSGGLSGDFFDWQRMPDGLALTVADVMGKGIGAAMIAATVRSALRIALPTGGALDSLARVSSVVQADLANNEAFVTMFHARLRSASGELTVVDAGHGLAVLVRADGSTELMPSQNLPLGVLIGQEWKVTRHSMRTGDLLLVFSDGVLDLFDGTMEALRQAAAVASKGVHTAQDAVERIVKLASGTQDDDVTVIAVQRVA
ncbi:PP2C family protein-serine/threonine phosphatase [Lysobacter korlensis]|uniref:PP2C family protein-serine/threonine phosphatase n=1 Tax=Lysobacter korlensis TaxID=553636 RepID=A0ABV6S0X1_9GAMM